MVLTDAGAGLSWNVVDDVRRLFQFGFMVNALQAGTVVAVMAAVIGWYMVVRRQSFAGHTIAVVGFPGAAGATLIGVSALYGYFAFCVAAAVLISTVAHSRGRAFSQENAVTGTVQTFLLALGFLFVSLYRGNLNGINSLLFGNFLGITTSQVLTLFLVALGALGVLGVISRPLLFASIDPDVASARGVPVRAVSLVFLVLLGLAAAEASQITGALLVFALLVMPAATAQRLTARPVLGGAIAVVLGLAVTWIGLGVAYYSPYPIGFWVTTLAFAAYVAAVLWARLGARTSRAVGAAA
ncbi:MAG TPA: metal ABC transporter permease [Acidimicrobiales bacterium]|nr:metal ABC transporter permease [Acidimicrobiales bacterium]